MTKIIGTKEEYKRFRSITVSKKMHVWGEGLSLHIEGKTRMVDTLLGHILKFCKKHQIRYDKPIKKYHNKRVEVWVVLELQEYQIGDLEHIIEKYNRVRKNKVTHEIY